MTDYILEAKRSLPSNKPKGTIVKIPVNVITGKCVKGDVTSEGQNILFYGFVKNFSGWQYLGRGLTS